MGHMHPQKLSEMMMKYIYAKGKASVNDFIAKAKKDKIGVSCSEGVYHEDYMYEMAFDVLLGYHFSEQFLNKGDETTQVEIAGELTHDQHEVMEVWCDNDKMGDFWTGADSDEMDKFWETWKTIEWKFQTGMRQKYLDKEIHHLSEYTS